MLSHPKLKMLLIPMNNPKLNLKPYLVNIISYLTLSEIKQGAVKVLVCDMIRHQVTWKEIFVWRLKVVLQRILRI